MTSVKRPKRPGSMRQTVCALLLLAQLLPGTRLWATPLQTGEVDSLLAPASVFSREEVASLVSNILADADEEICRTAEEAVKAASIQSAGEIAFLASLAESWEAEAGKLARSRRRWRNAALAEALVIAGSFLVLGMTR